GFQPYVTRFSEYLGVKPEQAGELAFEAGCCLVFTHVYPRRRMDVAYLVDGRRRSEFFIFCGPFVDPVRVYVKLQLQMRIDSAEFVLYGTDQEFLRDKYFHDRQFSRLRVSCSKGS